MEEISHFKMRMVGLIFGGKQITDYAPDFWLIADADGNDMGYITSPWWSPELNTNIALRLGANDFIGDRNKITGQVAR